MSSSAIPHVIAVTGTRSEETPGSVVPISQMTSAPLLHQSTGARLRAMLFSARTRRHQVAKTVDFIRVPMLLRDSVSDDSSSDSESDSGSDYSSTSSKFTTYSVDSLTSAGSPPSTPTKSACVPLPPAGPTLAPRANGNYHAFKATHHVLVDRSKTDLILYLYQGGETRVMTGGVMLGPRPAAHVVKYTRS